jgi:hypothetical protein
MGRTRSSEKEDNKCILNLKGDHLEDPEGDAEIMA